VSRKTTKEARLARANARAGAAVSLFETAAKELDDAAAAAEAIVAETEQELEVLLAVQEDANATGKDARAKAAKIRSFFA
jgi:hypothetical protein